MMDNRMKQALDRYITGNYGEDSIGIDEDEEIINNYVKPILYMPQYAEYKGWLVDVKIRKEKGLNRYAGRMIIYNKDLKKGGIFRASITYLCEKSISAINKEIMKVFEDLENRGLIV